MSKVVLSNITSGFASTDDLNTNFDAIETAFDNTLSLDGSTPNSVGAALDMNGHRIINLPPPGGANEPARLSDIPTTVSLTVTSAIGVNITDSANLYTATNVEGALSEAVVTGAVNQTVGGNKSFTGNISTTGNLQVDGNTTLGNAGSDTVTVNGTAAFAQPVSVAGPINITSGNVLAIVEGSSSDAFETTFTVTNPTADRTVLFPDADLDLTSLATSLAQGNMRVAGTVGTNNTTTPLTKYDLSAKSVALINSSGQVRFFRNTSTYTVDTGLAGPSLLGRDKAGAFSASSWLHLFFISDGTSLSVTISDTATPENGPSGFPSGYSYWAYAGSLRFNASSNLLTTFLRGSTVYYRDNQNILSGGTASGETSLTTNLNVAVPPNTLSYALSGTVNVTGGPQTVTGNIRVVTGFDAVNFQGTFESSSTLAGQYIASLPYTGFLAYSVTNSGSGNFTVGIRSYQCPNGGE